MVQARVGKQPPEASSLRHRGPGGRLPQIREVAAPHWAIGGGDTVVGAARPRGFASDSSLTSDRAGQQTFCKRNAQHEPSRSRTRWTMGLLTRRAGRIRINRHVPGRRPTGSVSLLIRRAGFETLAAHSAYVRRNVLWPITERAYCRPFYHFF